MQRPGRPPHLTAERSSQEGQHGGGHGRRSGDHQPDFSSQARLQGRERGENGAQEAAGHRFLSDPSGHRWPWCLGLTSAGRAGRSGWPLTGVWSAQNYTRHSQHCGKQARPLLLAGILRK